MGELTHPAQRPIPHLQCTNNAAGKIDKHWASAEWNYRSHVRAFKTMKQRLAPDQERIQTHII